MLSKTLLRRLSLEDLQRAIKAKRRLGRVDALESKREALLKQVAKIDRKLSKLGSSNGSTAASKPGWKKSYKMSAATRRKMSLADKRRYAGKGEAATALEGEAHDGPRNEGENGGGSKGAVGKSKGNVWCWDGMSLVGATLARSTRIAIKPGMRVAKPRRRK